MPYRDTVGFKTPPDSTKIWRYMDLSKFVAMLQHRALHFASLYELRSSDPHEGCLTLQSEQEALRQAQASGGATPIPEADLRRLLVGSSALAWKTYCVSCWHANDDQSAAMWHLYLHSGQGIAVQSTVGRLKAFVAKAPYDARVAQVNYSPSRWGDGFNLLRLVLEKRPAFAHENEVRAILSWERERDNWKEGAEVVGDLNELIERVHTAPGSPLWQQTMIATVAADYRLNVPVRRSDLMDNPILSPLPMLEG